MPLSTEHVPNKALNGRELIEIVVNDVRRVLEQHGLFSVYVAYPRVAYKIQLHFEFPNPFQKSTDVLITPATAPQPKDNILVPPLDFAEGEDEIVEVQLESEREVESPNQARIDNLLPITVTVQDQGKTVERKINYDPSDYPAGKPPVDRDLSPPPRKRTLDVSNLKKKP